MTADQITPTPVETKMMNLTLHIQRDEEVSLVKEATSLELERSPQGVYIGRGDDGLAKAVQEVISNLTQAGYLHVLVGGCTGLVAGIVSRLIAKDMKVALYEFESEKKRDPLGKLTFKHIGIRRIY
jgi:hypothetical protein